MIYLIKVAALSLGIPAVAATAYLLYLHRKVSQRVTSETKLLINNPTLPPSHKIPPETRKPVCIPSDVTDNHSSEWILAYERVISHPISHSRLDSPSLQSILTKYIRATMTAFGKTPQVFFLKLMVPRGDRTFEREYIRRCDFEKGDRVNGMWRVAYRGGGGTTSGNRPGEYVELPMEAPVGYRGPVVQGVVVVGVQRVDEDHVVFVNETWMWRRRGDNPVLLESAVGRRLHVLLSGWLVTKGVDALLGHEIAINY